MSAKLPLGERSAQPDVYAPEVLYPMPRRDGRDRLGIRGALPFRGEDLWNAWELTWLDRAGKPCVATAAFRVPADTPNLVESKSLKLYLNSLAMTRFASVDEVTSVIADDLSRVAAGRVIVELFPPAAPAQSTVTALPGDCIDPVETSCDAWEVDPSLLRAADADVVSEELHSHLLRSNCPVTGQPDMGSVLVRYHGPRIDRGSLLRYLVSYRRHNAFHESCVERMFMDIKARCRPARLSVYARYTRRGGIDINPFRTDFEDTAENLRLWRQ